MCMVCVRARTFMYVHVCEGQSDINVGYLPQPLQCLRQGLLAHLELTEAAKLDGPRAAGICLWLSHQPWDHRYIPPPCRQLLLSPYICTASMLATGKPAPEFIFYNHQDISVNCQSFPIRQYLSKLLPSFKN